MRLDKVDSRRRMGTSPTAGARKRRWRTITQGGSLRSDRWTATKRLKRLLSIRAAVDEGESERFSKRSKITDERELGQTLVELTVCVYRYHRRIDVNGWTSVTIIFVSYGTQILTVRTGRAHCRFKCAHWWFTIVTNLSIQPGQLVVVDAWFIFAEDINTNSLRERKKERRREKGKWR